MINNSNTLSTQSKIGNKQSEHSWVLLFSSLFSIIAAHFVTINSLGVNYILVCISGISAMIFVRKKFQQEITNNEYLLMISAIIMSLLFIIRQSEVLYWLNVFSIFMIICLAFAQRYTGSINNIPMIAWLLTPFHFIHLCFISATQSISIGFTPASFLTDKQQYIRSIILGIFWTLPILLILGSLLMSSDSRFEHFAMKLFSFKFSEFFKEILIIIIYFPLVSAFFYATILGSALKAHQEKKSSLSLEGIQILTILTLINLLFLSYILIQFSYFFGGDQLILETGKQTYSSYARRGFWELITLAIIVLPLLLIAHWLQRNESKSLQIWFNRASFLLIFCLVIIEASAIHRMYLYVKIYDLTELRFYSSIFMFYMMGGLITFCVTVLNNKRGQFITTMVIKTIVVILFLHIINPDAQISQYNMSQNQYRSIDTHYLKKLSTDAYPTIYSKRSSLDTRASCALQRQLKSKLQQLQNKSSQWNWSLHQAHKVIQLWKEQCTKR